MMELEVPESYNALIMIFWEFQVLFVVSFEEQGEAFL